MLKYKLQVISQVSNTVIDDIETDDAQLIVDKVAEREYEICELMDGCNDE